MYRSYTQSKLYRLVINYPSDMVWTLPVISLKLLETDKSEIYPKNLAFF